MLKALPYIGAVGFIIALVFVSFKWGETHKENEQVTDQNKALLEFVEKQKEVYDRYEPILGKLKTAPKNGIDPTIDYTIDAMPQPKYSNKSVRPSSKTSETKK